MEWIKRVKACSIRLKLKFKENFIHTHTHRKQTTITTNLYIMYIYLLYIKINNMNLIMEKSPPQKYQQPISRDLYRWNGNKRAKGKRG